MINKFQELKSSLIKLGKLYLQSTKLSIVEGLTMFFGGIALAAVGFVCVIIFLTFISFGCAEELRCVMTPALAYFLVGIFWLVVFMLIFIFRVKLIYNPVVKFISKLILQKNKEIGEAEEPEEGERNEK